MGGPEVNKAAGKVDGEISLVLEGLDADTVAKRLVNRHLRPLLPAAVFEAVHGEGASYLAAYKNQMQPKQDSGETLIFRPHLYDLPTIERCKWCGLDPATHLAPEPTSDLPRASLVCRDCKSRSERALDHSGEDRVLDENHRCMKRCSTFGDLANLNLRSGDTEANPRLATVYADGNNISSYMGCILSRTDDSLSEVCQDLQAATEAALNDGIKNLVDGRREGDIGRESCR